MESLSPEEQLTNIQKVYTQCISEIVEIVYRECQEKGTLLQKIWDIHISLVNASVTRLEAEKNTQYSNFISEVEKIRNAYSSLLDNLSKENKEKNALIEDKDYLIKKLTRDITSLKKKETRSNKTIQSLGDAINELKDMFDSVLSENIRLKLSKDEETNLRKGERDILKKQFDSLVKSKNQAKQGIFQRVEKLMKTQVLAHSPSKESSSKEGRSFAFELDLLEAGKDLNSFGTLKDIVLKDIREEEIEEMNQDLDGMTELFTKEIGVDTKDLLPVNNKETTTKDLARYFSKEESAQTVYFDEINEENEMNAAAGSDPDKALGSPFSKIGRLRGSVLSPGTIKLEQIIEAKGEFTGSPLEKQLLVKRRMFSFSDDAMHHLDKFKEIQSYTLTGICEWYSGEIEGFFSFVRILTENLQSDDFFARIESFDWLGFGESFRNVSVIHEQFIKNIKNRDTTRSKEILEHKIELLERKIEMDDAEKMRNLFRNNYNKLREKFEEFYRMTIKIQNLNEEEEPTMQSIMPGALFESPNDPRKKRRKSMTLINEDDKKEFLTKIQEEFKRKKGKTMVKPKISEQKSAMTRTIITPMKKYFDDEKDLLPVLKTKTSPIQKFEDIPDQPAEVGRKITHFSIKKPEETKEKEKDNSNSISIEGKGPPNFNLGSRPSNIGIKITQSYNDLGVIEDTPLLEPPPQTQPLPLTTKSSLKKITKEKSAKMMQSVYLSKNLLFNENAEGSSTNMNANFDVRGTLEMIDKEKREVQRLEEKKLKEQQDFKDLIANEQMIDLINKANNLLPQKKSWDKISSPNAEKCYAFLHRIEVSEIGPTKLVTLSTVLKTISQLTTELIKLRYKKQGNLNPLSSSYTSS